MSKKILIFAAGVVTGIILTFVFAIVYNKSSNSNLTLFDYEGSCVSTNSFEVFQVLDNGDALASEIEPGHSIATGIIALFPAGNQSHFYDDQIISIPEGKCARQIGVYKYNSKLGERTVPVVAIRDK